MVESVPIVTEEAAREAEELKVCGNNFLKEKKYVLAIQQYSDAIALNPASHVYHGNRALAHIRLEEYGSAIADADKALEINPKYVKAYYRRADANLALGKMKVALLDFRRAAKYVPNDRDLARKLQQCEKVVRVLQFERALATPKEEIIPAYTKIVVGESSLSHIFLSPSFLRLPRNSLGVTDPWPCFSSTRRGHHR